MTVRPTVRSTAPSAAATLATASARLVLGLAWLGIVARGLYASALGPLMRPEAYWPAVAALAGKLTQRRLQPQRDAAA